MSASSMLLVALDRCGLCCEHCCPPHCEDRCVSALWEARRHGLALLGEPPRQSISNLLVPNSLERIFLNVIARQGVKLFRLDPPLLGFFFFLARPGLSRGAGLLFD